MAGNPERLGGFLHNVLSTATARIWKKAPPVATIDNVDLLEEETLLHYSLRAFYPVKVGETFKRRYKVLGKLGYGSSSTVWLAIDTRENEYVALKIFISESAEEIDEFSSAYQELTAYRHLGRMTNRHVGYHCLRLVKDYFYIWSPAKRRHMCFVSASAVIDLGLLKRRMRDNRYELDYVKYVTKCLLFAIDGLHSGAGIIHTDVKVDDVFFTVTNNEAFKQVADVLQNNKPLGKYDKKSKRCIYQPIDIMGSMNNIPWWRPVLGDLGEACIATGEGQQKPRTISCESSRAPEIRLGMPWDFAVDIWALGVIVWYLFHGKFLFDVKDNDPENLDLLYLAEMQGVLGPPPLDFIHRNSSCSKYWDESGQWKHTDRADVTLETMEDREDHLQGCEKEVFFDFIRSMLTWKPEDRKTAKELLEHPWLNHGKGR